MNTNDIVMYEAFVNTQSGTNRSVNREGENTMVIATIKSALFDILEDAEWDKLDSNACQQVRAMYATMLIVAGMEVDTAFSDDLIYEIYNNITGISFEDFENFMYAYVV